MDVIKKNDGTNVEKAINMLVESINRMLGDKGKISIEGEKIIFKNNSITYILYEGKSEEIRKFLTAVEFILNITRSDKNGL